MSYKVCYVTTIAGTLDSFILDSANYNIMHGDWKVTFISQDDKNFSKKLPQTISFIPLDMRRGYSLSDIKAIWVLYRIFKQGQYDLVEYATTKASLYASIAARLAKVPVRLYGQLGISYASYIGLKGFVVKTIEKIICNNSTNVYGVCQENLDTAIRDGLYSAKKGYVVGTGSSLGVDLQRFEIKNKSLWCREIRERYGIAPSDFVFGYVGMLRKEKGLDELFDAFQAIEGCRSNVKLMVVGDTNVVEGIDPQKLAIAQNSQNVIFTGRTSEVQKFFAAMDCFVFPSYHEGFGNVTIEAEAMGVPIVATDIPGTRTAMLRDTTGLLVEKENVAQLQEGMLKMLDSPALREQFSELGRDYVAEYFDKNKMCEWIFANRTLLLEKHDG